MRRAIVDFLTAFIIFGIVLLSIVPIATADFFEDAFLWNSDNLSLSLFDYSITIDKRIPYVFNEVISVNDLFFGKSFSKSVKYVACFFLDLTRDFVSLSYDFAKDITGAA